MRLQRALLQSETQALDDRISEPYGVREPGGISLSGCHPNRVQANSLVFFVNDSLSEQLTKHAIILIAVFLQERKNILGKYARKTQEIRDWFTRLHEVGVTNLKIPRIPSHIIANSLIERR